MRFDALYVASTGTRLPTPTPVAEAEARGWCDRRATRGTGVESVCVAEESGPELAAGAARVALDRSGVPRGEVDLVLHAHTYHQGHDLWPAASYVQRVAVGNRCPAFEVRQMSNGGLAALELAAAHLVADPSRRHALVTTGDRFCPPGFDRWLSDRGTVYGDGGAALVLSKHTGYARVRSLVSVSDPSLERMSRGDDPFGAEPFAARKPVDLVGAGAAFVRDEGLDSVLDRIVAGQREAFERALADADAKLAEVEWVVPPNLGRARVKAHLLDPFGIAPDRTTWSWGRRVGHLGAGDQIAGLDHLFASGRVRPGDRCLLAGVGAGFTWSAAVVEVLRLPPWAGAGG